jgi:ABC-2 type transport system permease protein
VQVVVGSSAVTGIQLREDLNAGVFQRFRWMPIARIAPLAGALLADGVRYMVATAMGILTGLALGYRPDPRGALMAAALTITCALALSWIFAICGLLRRTTAGVQGLSTDIGHRVGANSGSLLAFHVFVACQETPRPRGSAAASHG